MGWESRNGRGRYYYRSRRFNGKVIHEYVGTGSVGELAAQLDAQRRARLAVQRQAWDREQERLKVEDGLLENLDVVCGLATRTEFEAAGYHQHHGGEWRKRRGQSNEDE